MAEKLVSGTAVREEVFRVRGVFFDLFAKAEDVVVDRSGVRDLFKTPDVREQLVAGDNLAFVLEKVFQELEFAGIGLDLAPLPE